MGGSMLKISNKAALFWIGAFLAISVFGVFLRVLLQHWTTTTTTTTTTTIIAVGKPTSNDNAEYDRDNLSGGGDWEEEKGEDPFLTNENPPPSSRIARVSALARAASAWSGTWRGKHWIALGNMLFNIAIFASSEYEYSSGGVPTVTMMLTGLSKGSSLWVATLVLSGTGAVVHAAALLSDWRSTTSDGEKSGQTLNLKYSVFRDENFHRASVIKALLLATKLQLVTTGMKCSCEPQNYSTHNFKLTHPRSTCDLGSSLESVLNRGLLALQIILSYAILALMTSTDAQPLLSLRKIPGVRSKRLLVWSFVVSTGLLQFITLFLTVEAVFLPQILNDRKCDYSDDNAATDSAFTVVQSGMNTILSMGLVVLIMHNNIWRSHLQPIVEAVKKAQLDQEPLLLNNICDWEGLRGSATPVLLLLVAALMLALFSSGLSTWCLAWASVSFVAYTALVLVVDTLSTTAVAVAVLLLPPSITVAVLIFNASSNDKLGDQNDEYSTDSLAWMLLVAIVAAATFLNPQVCLHALGGMKSGLSLIHI